MVLVKIHSISRTKKSGNIRTDVESADSVSIAANRITCRMLRPSTLVSSHGTPAAIRIALN